MQFVTLLAVVAAVYCVRRENVYATLIPTCRYRELGKFRRIADVCQATYLALSAAGLIISVSGHIEGAIIPASVILAGLHRPLT